MLNLRRFDVLVGGFVLGFVVFLVLSFLLPKGVRYGGVLLVSVTSVSLFQWIVRVLCPEVFWFCGFGLFCSIG